MICVELSSVHTTFDDNINDAILHAIFADGCAAAVLKGAKKSECPKVRQRPGVLLDRAILFTPCCVLPLRLAIFFLSYLPVGLFHLSAMDTQAAEGTRPLLLLLSRLSLSDSRICSRLCRPLRIRERWPSLTTTRG